MQAGLSVFFILLIFGFYNYMTSRPKVRQYFTPQFTMPADTFTIINGGPSDYFVELQLSPGQAVYAPVAGYLRYINDLPYAVEITAANGYEVIIVGIHPNCSENIIVDNKQCIGFARDGSIILSVMKNRHEVALNTVTPIFQPVNAN